MNDCKCGTPHSQVYEIWWIQHVSIVTLKTSGSQQALLTFQVLIGLITGLMPKKKNSKRTWCNLNICILRSKRSKIFNLRKCICKVSLLPRTIPRVIIHRFLWFFFHSMKHRIPQIKTSCHHGFAFSPFCCTLIYKNMRSIHPLCYGVCLYIMNVRRTVCNIVGIILRNQSILRNQNIYIA